jgi:hypothetical protein
VTGVSRRARNSRAAVSASLIRRLEWFEVDRLHSHPIRGGQEDQLDVSRVASHVPLEPAVGQQRQRLDTVSSAPRGAQMRGRCGDCVGKTKMR